MVSPRSGRCSTVWPWKPTTATALGAIPFAVAVGTVAGRAEASDLLAVGVDERHVHPVIGGAAHQPDRSGARHGGVLRLNPALDLLHHRPKRGDKKRRGGMSAYKSDFLRVLAERGFIHQVSDAEGLDAKAAAGPLAAYVGFDATAPSLHIGNLLTIMMLRWLQKTGHRPIALMGGGTSKIGDPSGKDT